MASCRPNRRKYPDIFHFVLWKCFESQDLQNSDDSWIPNPSFEETQANIAPTKKFNKLIQ